MQMLSDSLGYPRFANRVGSGMDSNMLARPTTAAMEEHSVAEAIAIEARDLPPTIPVAFLFL